MGYQHRNQNQNMPLLEASEKQARTGFVKNSII
jgi:hypothetical protein